MGGDSRFSLFLCFLSAALAWQFSLYKTLIFLNFLVFLYMKKGKSKALFYSLSFFILFWGIFVFFIKSIGFNNGFYFTDMRDNFYFTLDFIGRLWTMGIIGLLIPIFISGKEIAYVLTWLLKPILKDKAWQVGLLTLLVLRLIPQFLQRAMEVKNTIKYRLYHVKAHYLLKIKLFIMNFIKQIALENKAQAIALLTRNMYSEEAFLKKWKPFSWHLFFDLKWEICLLLLSLTLYFI